MKNTYLKDGRVNLKLYNSKLLHKNNSKAMILFNTEDDMNKFLDDWCLDDDCIINQKHEMFIILAPICLAITDKELDRLIS